jgi:DNA-binding response OmpR family regulator
VILIVEDDDAIATGLALNLKLAGRSTAIARDGDDAIEQTSREEFELVLLDINLPKKNGLEVLASLRAADNVVPVIVLSARDGEYDKVAALRLGADDYVTKPFALAELLARIDAVLRRAAPPTTSPSVAPPPCTDALGWTGVTARFAPSGNTSALSRNRSSLGWISSGSSPISSRNSVPPSAARITPG